MKASVTTGLLRLSDDSNARVELTTPGHELALALDYESAISRFEGEAAMLTGCRKLQISCMNLPVPEADFGANMPPVVSWLSQSGSENNNFNQRFLLHLLPDQPCFQGHFPGRPILAGVIQLHWAVRLSQTCLAGIGVTREILRLKYHNIAVPPRFVELQLQRTDATQDSTRVQFRVHSQDCVHAQGTIVFEGSS